MGVADASGAEQGACSVRPAPSALCGVTGGGAHGCHCAPLRATPSTEKNVPVALELLPPGHEGAKGAAGARGARRAPVHHAAFPCSCGAEGGLLQPPLSCASAVIPRRGGAPAHQQQSWGACSAGGGMLRCLGGSFRTHLWRKRAAQEAAEVEGHLVCSPRRCVPQESSHATLHNYVNLLSLLLCMSQPHPPYHTPITSTLSLPLPHSPSCMHHHFSISPTISIGIAAIRLAARETCCQQTAHIQTI